MIKPVKEFDLGYAPPVNRGARLWNGTKGRRVGPERPFKDLIYEALGEEDFWSQAYNLEGIRVTIEIDKATKL